MPDTTFNYLAMITAPRPTPTVIPPPLDQYYHLPRFNSNRYAPMSVTGFVFEPAAGTFDFSAVPEFDLSRLQYLQHVKSRIFLYARPLPEWQLLGLAEVDGAPVPPPPSSGKVLKVKIDTSAMLATDDILAAYDLPPGYVSI